MRRFMPVVVILIGVGQLQNAYPKGDRGEEPVTNKELSKAMSKAHRGQKSAHASVVRELKKELPDWEQLAKDGAVFVDMGKMFNRRGPFVSTSPKSYIESTEELVNIVDPEIETAS